MQVESIQKYLDPITDTVWKLEQCCRAVAPSSHLQRTLLKYGLLLAERAKEADLDAVPAAAPEEEDEPGSDEEGDTAWWAMRPVWNLPLAAYRLVLLLQSDRFSTFEALGDAYEPTAWMVFRDAALQEYAGRLARHRRLRALQVIVHGHPLNSGLLFVQVNTATHVHS